MKKFGLILFTWLALCGSALAQSCPYSIPSPWYWSVQNASPGTQVWSGDAGAYVALADGTYTAWVAAGCTATSINTDTNLFALMAQFALSNYVAGTGYGSEDLATSPATLTNPLKAFYSWTTLAATPIINLPKMNLPTSRPIGVDFIIQIEAGTTNPVAVKNHDGTAAFTLFPGSRNVITNSTFDNNLGALSIDRQIINSGLLASTKIRVGNAGGVATVTGISGDATLAASIGGLSDLTLATVNSNVGSFGSTTNCVSITVNAKGLITAASQAACTLPTTSLTGTLQAAQEPAHTGDVTNSAGSLAMTLANIPTGTPMAGSLLASAIAAPGTPAAGKGSLYVDSTSKNLAVKDDAGVVKHGVQTVTATASQWIRAIDDAGAGTKSQPAFSDISGTATAAQTPLAVTKVIVQKFTASGTYTPTSGMLYAALECVGGGGAGGGAAGTVGDVFNGGGGGGGGYSRITVTAATIGASKTVTIGAGGSAGTAGANNGGNGADSCVTSSSCTSGQIVAGKGGSGGLFSSAAQLGVGGLGGVAGTGDIASLGQAGQPGFYSLVATIVPATGMGGSTPFAGGANATQGSVNGVAGAANSGGGGSGGGAQNTASNFAGGAGGSGICVATEYVNG